MASGDGFSQVLDEPIMDESKKMSEDEDDDEDEDDETWDEMHAECENFLSCLFCTQKFKTMAVALEHCKTDHNFNLTNLKNKFNMDCYSYICMINYVRKEEVNADVLLSLKEPVWLNEEYLAPVIQDDPWLMFDFEGLESPTDSGSLMPEQNYHVVNSENGLVTLTEHHFVQLQHKIKHLTLQVQEKEEELSVAADQIQKMKAVTKNLVCGDSSDCLDGKELEKQIFKMKLKQDDGYFSSYSHFRIHHEMLSDKVRTSSYRDAIMNNTSLISSKLILDVGCGTGILSMFAAAAGASKVFSVDQSEIIYNAMDIVRENNLSSKIEVIHGKVEDISLPVEKVDVIVSEWMGYFLLFEGMLDSIISARDRFLKSDGYLLPNKCILYIVGVSDSDLHEEMLGFWSNVYGFKMSSIVNEVVKEAHIFQVKDKTVVTSPAPVLNLNLYTANLTSMNFSSDFSLECEADGSLTALCGYFDALFDLPNPSVLSTSPKTEKTHWKQTVFFLKNPVPIFKGSTINGRINCERLNEDSRALCITIRILDQTNPSFGGGSEVDRNPEANSSPVLQQVVDLPPILTDQNTSSSSLIPPPLPLPPPPPVHIEDLPPPKLDFSAPPPYEVAAKLPTYEEVQREKTRLGEPQINNPSSTHQNSQSLAFLAIDTEGHDSENESGLLGTDFMFFTAFLVAFLFNWIGFLLLMCFCHTIAARYGALSGFGLSLAKWTFIVKHSTDLASRENSWLWWLIMAFGLLIFVRAIIQYLNIKRGWRFLSGTAQERLLFFY